jgi:prepilin peptidase CpaA
MLTAAAIVIKAVMLALLVRIAWIDFQTQKISNRNVLILAGLGAAGLLLSALSSGSWSSLAVGFAASVVLLVVMLPFWLLRKVGAGDVKILAAAPLLTGGDYLFAFTLLLLFFAVLTAVIVKNPLLLPASAFRKYVEMFDRKGVVPFGVPISASLIGILILQSVGTPLLP